MEEDLKIEQIDFFSELVISDKILLKLIVRRAADWPAWNSSRELLLQYSQEDYDAELFKDALKSLLNDSRLKKNTNTLLSLLKENQSDIAEILIDLGFEEIGKLENVEFDGNLYSYIFYCLKI